jgi:hypothetical protein
MDCDPLTLTKEKGLYRLGTPEQRVRLCEELDRFTPVERLERKVVELESHIADLERTIKTFAVLVRDLQDRVL